MVAHLLGAVSDTLYLKKMIIYRNFLSVDWRVQSENR